MELSPEQQNRVNERAQTLLKTHPVMLFMKGDRSFPQCGFSARVVEILEHLGVDYGTFDILADPEMRMGMKNYSQWPTFPQLFVDSELVGGCDIISSLFQSGELQKLLQEKGLIHSEQKAES